MTQKTAHRNLSILAKLRTVNHPKFLEKIFFRLCFSLAEILEGARRESGLIHKADPSASASAINERDYE